jgi:3',5'-cyclic AMP phosphodiesterase CpdA
VIFQRRSPRVWTFAVDHDAVQVCWRRLRPGRLRLDVRSDGRSVAPPLELEVTDAPAGPEPVGAPRAAGGAATIPGLPAGRLLEVVASGTAVDAPIELVARTLPALHGEELVRLGTISDLHLGTVNFGQRGTLVEDGDPDELHPWRCAEAAIAESAAWGARELVAKGDLTHSGLPDQWRAYARLAAASPIPIHAMAGNHDGGAYGGRRVLAPAEAAAAFGFALPQRTSVHDLPGLRLVLADTTIPASRHGSVHPVADDVIQAAAEAPADHGVLVVLHHQLHPHLLPEGPPVGVPQQESARFLDRLGAVHPHVVVTSGHTHRNRRWGRAGVVVTQVGATKDYPGVWAGYRVHEGGMSQIVRRIERPDCVAWTDHSRLAVWGLWEHVSPGRLDARCFAIPWRRPT